MQIDQTPRLIKMIIGNWPVMNQEETKVLLREMLVHQEYEAAVNGINQMIKTWTSTKTPLIAHFIEAIGTQPQQKRYGNCAKCKNEGWQITSYEGHGTYRKCDCDNQGDSPLSNPNPKATSQGYPIAPPLLAQQRFEQGLRKAQPTWTDEQIEEQMSNMFKKRGFLKPIIENEVESA